MPKGITVVDLNSFEPTRAEGRVRYNAITKAKDGAERMSFHLVEPEAGRTGTAKYESDEIVLVLDGSLTLGWGGKSVKLTKNMLAWIPAGQEFHFLYGADTRVIGVYSPARE